MNRKRRTPKHRADHAARAEAARLDAERERRLQWLAAQPVQFDDYWTPAEIHGNLHVLAYLGEYHAAMYGTPETFN